MDPSALTKTSFCGKEIDNVTNNDTKKFILDDSGVLPFLPLDNNNEIGGN